MFSVFFAEHRSVAMVRAATIVAALLAIVAGPAAVVAPSVSPLAAIERAFRCPDSIADPDARAAADERFLRQAEAAAPHATPQQIAAFHRNLLRRHGCGQAAAQTNTPPASLASSLAVRLSIPASASRPVRDDDDWTQVVPYTGKLRGDDDCDRPALRQQTRSLDGGYVYQRVCRWVTSDDIIQVRLSDGRRREVTAGNSLAVIRNGPWRGMLLVSKHKYRDEGGSYDATWVVRPDGKEMFAVPGTDDGDDRQVEAWLRRNGWTAD